MNDFVLDPRLMNIKTKVPATVGESLMLPEQLEIMRDFLSATLPQIHTPGSRENA